jgi:ubiquitin carboxyl-terminal hydrolase 48
MVIKRKRHASPSSKGLVAGEQLKRNKLAGRDYSAWGWVGTEVTDPSEITREHLLATCGFSKKNNQHCCPNIYVEDTGGRCRESKPVADSAEREADVIVISDDEEPPCSKKRCKSNPNCLNYLGQEKWEDEGKWPLTW